MNSIYVKIAKDSVERYIKNREILNIPKNIPETLLEKKKGVFVTIYTVKEDSVNLRGCIGTIEPQKNNAIEEIIHNSICAATQDRRFSPIQKKELPFLKYEVSILNEKKKVFSLKELNPNKFGIIVKTINGKTGLLLPAIPDIKSKEEQIKIACKKAGIDSQKEKFEIYKFTVEKYV